MNPWLIAVAALIGALVTAIASLVQNPIVINKVVTVVVSAIIAAAGVAVSFNYSGVTAPIGYFIAFLAGAGVGSGGALTATISGKVGLKRRTARAAKSKR